MNKKIGLWVVALITTVSVSLAQNFSVGINSGFTVPMGTKAKNLKKGNPTLAAFGDGFIPVGLEFRYKVSEQFFLNLNYAYNIGLAQTYKEKNERGLNMTVSRKTGLQQVSVGGAYLFETGEFKPYVGIDLGAAIWYAEAKNTYENSKDYGTQYSKNNTLSFIVSPKVGFEYELSDNLFLNFNLNYCFITGAKNVKTIDKSVAGGIETKNESKANVDASNLIGGVLGVGYRF